MDCFNETLNKPKLLIIGHARHGKDTVAKLIADLMGLSFVSSSEFVGRKAIWPMWGEERYCSFDDMFEDRVNFRAVWHNLISAYNTPDKSRTATEMLKEHSIYVGMRAIDELEACNEINLFDHIIWVEAGERHPPEGKDSNQMTSDLADIFIENNGPEENLTKAISNLQARLHMEGFEVNHTPPPTYVDDFPDEPMTDRIARMEKPATPATEDEEALLKRLMDNPTAGMNNPETLDPKYTAVEDTSLAVGTQAMESRSAEKPIVNLIVNPTLEESRKFHNEALMAECTPATMVTGRLPGPPKVIEDWTKTSHAIPYQEAKFGGKGTIGEGMFKHSILDEDKSPPIQGNRQGVNWFMEKHSKEPKTSFRVIPETEKWLEDEKKLSWQDAPEGSTQVLDHGFIRVLDIMGSDETICESARMSYGRGTKRVSDDQKLINYLVRNGHTSPLEMGEIRFHMRMPIFVMRQWVRHRTANLNEYSGRYSEMVPLWYVPENAQICAQNKVNKQGSAEPLLNGVANKVANTIAEVSKDCFQCYSELLKQGVSRETARMILPLNTYTEVVWKLDISNLLKFLVLRDDDHAQWEIRQYAIHVAKAIRDNFPLVFHAYLERRQSQTFTMDEVRALVTGDPDNLSVSQKQRMVMTRYNIFN